MPQKVRYEGTQKVRNKGTEKAQSRTQGTVETKNTQRERQIHKRTQPYKVKLTCKHTNSKTHRHGGEKKHGRSNHTQIFTTKQSQTHRHKHTLAFKSMEKYKTHRGKTQTHMHMHSLSKSNAQKN